MSWYLAVVDGPGVGARWHLPAGRTLVGRGPDCEVVLDDRQVSRAHAAVYIEDGLVSLDDLGSTNGTRVNTVRVLRAILSVGDRIQIGQVFLELCETTEGNGD